MNITQTRAMNNTQISTYCCFCEIIYRKDSYFTVSIQDSAFQTPNFLVNLQGSSQVAGVEFVVIRGQILQVGLFCVP